MEKIEEIREKIDLIDKEIVGLYLKRLELCKDIAIEKEKGKIGIEDNKRETVVLGKITENVPEELKPYLIELYQTIFKNSKQYQSMLLK